MTTEQNQIEVSQTISKLLSLSTLKYPPLRTWRTGTTAEEELAAARFCTLAMSVLVAAMSLMIFLLKSW